MVTLNINGPLLVGVSNQCVLPYSQTVLLYWFPPVHMVPSLWQYHSSVS